MRTLRNLILGIAAVMLSLTCTAQRQLPGAVQEKSILFTNGMLHLGNGTRIDRGAIGFRAGKITLIMDLSVPSTVLPEFDEVHDLEGMHVYPGLILMNTTLGLREVDAVRSTLDYSETGEMKPEVRALVAYNTDSKIIPTVRANGVLMAQVTPQGGMIPGNSGVVQLDAWNWEDAAVLAEDGIHVNWPQRLRRIYPWEKDATLESIAQERKERLDLLKDLFERAAAYYRNTGDKEFNQKCEALGGLFSGSKNLYIHTNAEKDIVESIAYFKSLGIPKIVLVGGYECGTLLGFLKSEQVPVILPRLHELPWNEDDDVKQNYRLPSLLAAAGVLFTIDYSGDMEAMGSRNLAFTAGTMAAYGMSKEEALQVVTLNAAKILGIGDRTGSLETGKDATFFISQGDALDMKTNRLTAAYIMGRKIVLENHQDQLYQMYLQKYGLK